MSRYIEFHVRFRAWFLWLILTGILLAWILVLQADNRELHQTVYRLGCWASADTKIAIVLNDMGNVLGKFEYKKD